MYEARVRSNCSCRKFKLASGVTTRVSLGESSIHFDDRGDYELLAPSSRTLWFVNLVHLNDMYEIFKIIKLKK